MTASFRRVIDEITSAHDLVDWQEAGSFTENIDAVVDSMTERFKPKRNFIKLLNGVA